MGRPRKTRMQLVAAKKANAANMTHLGKMMKKQQQEEAEVKRSCANPNAISGVVPVVTKGSLKSFTTQVKNSRSTITKSDPKVSQLIPLTPSYNGSRGSNIKKRVTSDNLSTFGNVSDPSTSIIDPEATNNHESSSEMINGPEMNNIVSVASSDDGSILKKQARTINFRTSGRGILDKQFGTIISVAANDTRGTREPSIKKRGGANKPSDQAVKPSSKIPVKRKVIVPEACAQLISNPCTSGNLRNDSVSNESDGGETSPKKLKLKFTSHNAFNDQGTGNSPDVENETGSMESSYKFIRSDVSQSNRETDADTSSITSTEDLSEGFCKEKKRMGSPKLIDELRAVIEKKTKEIELLQEENTRLRSLNMLLQESLVQKNEDLTFTEVIGYPNAEWLLSVSQNSEDSDYLFVKELLFHLFPNGVGNATATGRPSNNPKGRSKDAGARGKEPADHNTSQLEPGKVKYMKDRLYERRRILQDSVGIAMGKAKMINKHIGNIIANNPSLRNDPKQ